MYVDTSNRKCENCINPISNCKTCLEATPSTCISCDPPLVLLGINCANNCGIGYVLNPSSNTCEICLTSNCKTCNYPNKNECSSCEPPLVLLSSSKTCEN